MRFKNIMFTTSDFCSDNRWKIISYEQWGKCSQKIYTKSGQNICYDVTYDCQDSKSHIKHCYDLKCLYIFSLSALSYDPSYQIYLSLHHTNLRNCNGFDNKHVCYNLSRAKNCFNLLKSIIKSCHLSDWFIDYLICFIHFLYDC